MKLKTYYLIAALLASVLLSCKEKKQPVNDVPQVNVPDTTLQEAPVVQKQPEVVPEKQIYFLIAGCFEYKELAEKLQKKLKREGFDSQILPYFENLHLVSYSGYPDLQKARNALADLVQEAGKEKTWIHKLSE